MIQPVKKFEISKRMLVKEVHLFTADILHFHIYFVINNQIDKKHKNKNKRTLE